MLITIMAFTLLGASDGLPAVNLGKPQSNSERMVCKHDLEPGSRLAKRKVCMTVAQWAEWKRNEQLYLLRNQFNGSPK